MGLRRRWGFNHLPKDPTQREKKKELENWRIALGSSAASKRCLDTVKKTRPERGAKNESEIHTYLQYNNPLTTMYLVGSHPILHSIVDICNRESLFGYRARDTHTHPPFALSVCLPGQEEEEWEKGCSSCHVCAAKQASMQNGLIAGPVFPRLL